MNSIKGSFKSMYRNGAMTFASMVLISLTLVVVGFVGIISLNTNYITSNVLDSLSVYVYVKPTANADQVQKIKADLTAMAEVGEVKFSSKEEELKLLSGTIEDEESGITSFFSGESNPLSDVYIVTSKDENFDIKVLSNKIKTIENVENVKYGSESGTENFVNSMKIIQKVSLGIAVTLGVISLFIISNTIKLTITSRKLEIEIMRLVGATKMYIRLPFMFEGFIIGLIGGLFAFIILFSGYHYGLKSEFLITFSKTLLQSSDLFVVLLLSLPVCGMIIGSIGSFFATIHYLKK